MQLRELGVPRDEHLRDRTVSKVLGLLVDLLDVARLPERFEESFGLRLRAADVQPLVDDDVEADDEHHGQKAHHQLDDPMRLVEQPRDVQLRSERPGYLRRRKPWHNEAFGLPRMLRAGQMSHPRAVTSLLRAVALVVWMSVHGCANVPGGAVELSWK